MGGCFSWLLLIAAFVFTVLSMIRWFEQVTAAVDERHWRRVMLLVAVPFSVWMFPSRVSAGRPTAVPRHVPVRGFGSLGKSPPPVADGPPPGTPAEFLGMPKVPPKPNRPKSAVDPEQIAKLKQKMRDQGMLGE